MDKIIIEKIPENLGGGFTAYQEKTRYACVGDGETEMRALKDFLINYKSRHLSKEHSKPKRN